jgi:hypothetical protein
MAYPRGPRYNITSILLYILLVSLKNGNEAFMSDSAYVYHPIPITMDKNEAQIVSIKISQTIRRIIAIVGFRGWWVRIISCGRVRRTSSSSNYNLVKDILLCDKNINCVLHLHWQDHKFPCFIPASLLFYKIKTRIQSPRLTSLLFT